jgi:hypothetical protein
MQYNDLAKAIENLMEAEKAAIVAMGETVRREVADRVPRRLRCRFHDNGRWDYLNALPLETIRQMTVAMLVGRYEKASVERMAKRVAEWPLWQCVIELLPRRGQLIPDLERGLQRLTLSECMDQVA